MELVLFVLFALLILGYAGFTGLNTLLSFVFSAMTIWKVLLPGLLKGWNPIFSSLGITALLCFVIIHTAAGLHRQLHLHAHGLHCSGHACGDHAQPAIRGRGNPAHPVGSFGLVTVAPFTALLGGLVMVPATKKAPHVCSTSTGRYSSTPLFQGAHPNGNKS